MNLSKDICKKIEVGEELKPDEIAEVNEYCEHLNRNKQPVPQGIINCLVFHEQLRRLVNHTEKFYEAKLRKAEKLAKKHYKGKERKQLLNLLEKTKCPEVESGPVQASN